MTAVPMPPRDRELGAGERTLSPPIYKSMDWVQPDGQELLGGAERAIDFSDVRHYGAERAYGGAGGAQSTSNF